MGHVARASAAKRMHAGVIGIVDASDRLAIVGAIIGATTAERPCGGHAETGGVSRVARGRANVSSPATSGGDDRIGIARGDGLPAASVRVVLGTVSRTVTGRRTVVARAATAGHLKDTTPRG